MIRRLFFLCITLCINAQLAYTGHSGFFIGGSLSLNNTHYDGIYSTRENDITTYYPHSNDSQNVFGASVRFGYQKFSSDARFGARFYIEYNNNGYARYIDERGSKHKMDAYAIAMNADILFELLQIANATIGIFAGGGAVFDAHKFTNAYYSIYTNGFAPATLTGYGLCAQAGLSLTFSDKHRIELEIKHSNLVSDYDSGYISLNNQAESLILRAKGYLGYRLNYVYVF